MYDAIKKYIKGSVIELGAGIGNLTRYIINNHTTVTVSDYNEAYLLQLKQKFNGHPCIKEFTRIDLEDPRFEESYAGYSQSFDTIILLNVIEHLANDEQTIRNCNFLLKPRGHLILLAPAYQFLYSEMDRELGHYRRYTVRQLSTTATAGGLFTLRMFYFNFMGIPAWFFGKLRRQPVLMKGQMNVYDRLVPLFRAIDWFTGRIAGLSAIVIAYKK